MDLQNCEKCSSHFLPDLNLFRLILRVFVVVFLHIKSLIPSIFVKTIGKKKLQSSSDFIHLRMLNTLVCNYGKFKFKIPKSSRGEVINKDYK